MIIVAEEEQSKSPFVDRKSWPSTPCNISFYWCDLREKLVVFIPIS